MTTPSTMHFESVPTLASAYARAVFQRRKVRGEVSVPRIEATLDPVSIGGAELERYRELCGLTEVAGVPPTWPHVFAGALHAHVLADPNFPLPLIGLVHVRNRIEGVEPVDQNQPLSFRAWVDGCRPARRGVEFDIHTEAMADGAVVWREVLTALSRAAPDHPDAEQAASIEVPDDAEVAGHWDVPSGLGRRYAWLSGDWNPIHLSRITAKPLGFDRAIIHGMWSAARLLADIGEHAPARYVYDVSFRRPIKLPSRVVVRCADGPEPGSVVARVDGARDGKERLRARLDSV